ncbi:hypothetical protein CD538_23055 [Salmonella enterica subsp. enterica serovar Bareilly]|nr:hypothetical protein [Salmonella enterica subsp. enterica serovar Bareilly]EDI4164899.1 hypothetical protein [Salmonella enterica subsp. enterica serovar Bareilly]
MARTLARRTAKTVFFAVILLIVARSLGNPELYINHGLASKVAQLISGDINAESIYDAYFYLDVLSVLAITIVIYLVIVKSVKKIRSK